MSIVKHVYFRDYSWINKYDFVKEISRVQSNFLNLSFHFFHFPLIQKEEVPKSNIVVIYTTKLSLLYCNCKYGYSYPYGYTLYPILHDYSNLTNNNYQIMFLMQANSRFLFLSAPGCTGSVGGVDVVLGGSESVKPVSLL